ncbi:bifunctional aspartate kinase/homoserine dehydrogenase II [Shewanella sp. OPT22]|nr:bifunctional aspartate kinase/homoserine dehydrogenase II [Shewanella sp. OPT22]
MTISHLHKFGGSSLADADGYRRVAHILLTQGNANDMVVVSAAGKSTNKLYQLLEFQHSRRLWQQSLQELIEYQQHLAEDLLDNSNAQLFRERLSTDGMELSSLLSQDKLTEYDKNQLVAFGEVWSSRLLAAYLKQNDVASKAIDSRKILLAENDIVARVKADESRLNVQQVIEVNPATRLIFTGFICGDAEGNTLLLGRNGSDYSASLLSSYADVEQITIWTDVEGVFNADPNKITDAKLLASLSLGEADRLAKLGSPVLHSRTLQPLFGSSARLAVRSSFASHTQYTQIEPDSAAACEPVITSLQQVELLRLQSDLEPKNIYSILEQHGVSPLAWWGHTNQAFELATTTENRAKLLALLEPLCIKNTQVSVTSRFGLVALVSQDSLEHRHGFSRLLTRHSKPLFQDSNSLVALVPKAEVDSLSFKVHRRCTAAKKRFGVVVFGLGNIGKTWTELFQSHVLKLEKQLKIKLDIAGLVSTNQCLISDSAIDLSNWEHNLSQHGQPWRYDELLTQLDALTYDELIVLDITASASLTLKYSEFLQRGIHLVSANKLAGSGPLTFYNELKYQLQSRRLFWRYNASCGAGLPIQTALAELKNGGDDIHSVGGIFSGTLCWLFEYYDDSEPFSSLVLKAKSQGITEPDPRDDLSGRDMQRKLLILARELGMNLELSDIELESLVPAQLVHVSKQEFIERIDEIDESIKDQWIAAQRQQKVLRYIAKIELNNGSVNAKVALKRVDKTHPYASLTPGDNIFVIESEFYKGTPLIIRGPGAGREVTAAAIQTDLVQICRDLMLD